MATDPRDADPAETSSRFRIVRWWRSRTLNTRLSLLVTGAVAVTVLALAGAAWAAVNEIVHQQLMSELDTDARAIAAQPNQWRAAAPSLPDPQAGGGHGPHDLGPRWQILGPSAAIRGESASPLPVTADSRLVALGQRDRVEEQITLGGDEFWMLTVPASGGGAVQVAVSEGPSNHVLSAVALLLLSGSLIGIAASAPLGRGIARAGLAPVERLSAAVETVAATKDLSHPITVTGADAVARLGRSVNSLLAAIDAAQQAQRALVEDAGHELRTPMTSLRTNVELLLQMERQPELAHRLTADDRTKLLVDLDAQLAELATLTSELVELAREDTTRDGTEEVDLADVVEAAIARARVRAPSVRFVTEVEPITVIGRPVELERMVLNVLDNAAKWSPSGAEIHTCLDVDGAARARIRVTDEGPGIDEADRPYVFHRFYRASAARAMPGSGLGLAIVAQTATQHGGTVATEPALPLGTVVTIWLPRVSPAT